jgi:phage host-nuclease inhibitor protein Gam
MSEKNDPKMLNGGEHPAVDNVAREKAQTAYDTALSAFERTGELLREVSSLRTEVRDGFRRLERRFSNSKNEIKEIKDEWEDSKVTNLRHELSSMKKTRNSIVTWISGIAAAIIAGLIIAYFEKR